MSEEPVSEKVLPQNWLILRGLVREKRHWGDFPQLLQEMTSPGQVLALDLAGVGEQSRQQAPWRLTEYTNDLRRRWLSSKKSDGSWGVLAISMGAMIALDWLDRFQGDFSGAILINTSSRTDSGPFQRFRLEAVKEILRSLGQVGVQEREELVLRLTSNEQEANAHWVARWKEVAQDQSIPFSVFCRQVWAASRFREAERIAAPIYFLASRKDHLVDPSCSEKLARRLDKELFFHPTAGHDLPLDDPQWVLQKTREFSLKYL